MKLEKEKLLHSFIAAVFWLVVWQLVSMAVGSDVILPGPVSTVTALGRLIVTSAFWSAVLTSFIHIVTGFVCAVVAGILLAIGAASVKAADILVSPLMRLIKAVPVASFIVLLLLWINSGILPAVISFLMVLPVIYINVLTGIKNADYKLLEMARVFGISRVKKLKYVYLPAIKPHLMSAVSIGLGFCWKSGVAAEVIALSAGSIGRRLYDAKLYVMTDELFAWTVVIVLLCALFEKAIMEVVKKLG